MHEHPPDEFDPIDEDDDDTDAGYRDTLEERAYEKSEPSDGDGDGDEDDDAAE